MGSVALPINGIENEGFEMGAPERQRKTEQVTLAVEIISGKKKYGKVTVLNKFNMHVEEGTIYSLLGASGCGKTTALSCVIGVNKLDSGKIRIFGESPGSPNSGVPGKRVGYMPQGIVLNREFTTTEVLHYFGKIYGLSYAEVEERKTFYVDFLNLKTVVDNQLGDMSEGQKRRVSFAVALIHNPEILILDEPTVGVDPLLRERMWSHLVELTKGKLTTIIITTHYVEEAKSGNMIGLMRNGHLLVEESPPTLLDAFNTTTMEEIVLQLCLKQENDKAVAERRASIISQLHRMDTIGSNLGESVAPIRSNRQAMSTMDPQKWHECLKTRSVDRLQALFRKNIIVAARSIWFWVFLLLIPALNIYLICVCLVSEPRDLRFGVVNHEVPIGQECTDAADFCIMANLTCRYIKTLGTDPLTLVDFDSEESALDSVLNGDTYGFMVLPANFSDNLVDRFLGGSWSDEDGGLKRNETILGSQIKLRLDMTNSVVGLRLEHTFYKAFRLFSRNLQIACGENPDERDTPIVFQTPVYGVEGSFGNVFIVPGAAITFLSFMASLTCGLAFIIEKNDGMLTRARVAGVTHVEIMLSHLSIHFVVLLFQSLFAFLVMFLIFNVPQLGSKVLAYAIVILNGITGMSLGFIAASICDKETTAMMIAIGAILPTLLISGTLFPFEGLPQVVKYVGYVYPGTFPEFALKAILFKGWGLSHFTVWMGFVTSIGWIGVFWIIISIYHSYNS